MHFLWNSFVVILALWLQIIWLGFIFGSVIGVILLLIFFPDGFLLPLLLIEWLYLD